MSRLKKIFWGLLILFIAIQFVRPARNKSERILSTDMTKIYSVPDSVLTIFKTACYDCHSNNTRYPWYSNVQPGGWLLASHIKNGRSALNFSEFGSYSQRKQTSKLKAIVNSLNDGTMPLKSYTLIHADARLSKDEKTLIINWAAGQKNNLMQRINQ
jgi:hypothetical protein